METIVAELGIVFFVYMMHVKVAPAKETNAAVLNAVVPHCSTLSSLVLFLVMMFDFFFSRRGFITIGHCQNQIQPLFFEHAML